MLFSKLQINLYKLAHPVTVLSTCNSTCKDVHTEPFYLHKNKSTQILNLLSPGYFAKCVYIYICIIYIYTIYIYIYIYIYIDIYVYIGSGSHGAISRDPEIFWEHCFLIFPYRHHDCLGVRKLQFFNTSDPLKTYSVESNM